MGRPDMAIYKFTKLIFSNKSIRLNNYGKHKRDFTYIDDVTNVIAKLVFYPSKSAIPYQIYNISSNNPINIKQLALKISKTLNKKVKIKNTNLQIGDVINTNGSIKKIKNKIGYKPSVLINKGLYEFINWYKKFVIK